MRVTSRSAKEDLITQGAAEAPSGAVSSEKVLYDEFSDLLNAIVSKLASSVEFDAALSGPQELSPTRKNPELPLPQRDRPQPRSQEELQRQHSHTDIVRVDRVVEPETVQDNEVPAISVVELEATETSSPAPIIDEEISLEIESEIISSIIVDDNFLVMPDAVHDNLLVMPDAVEVEIEPSEEPLVAEQQMELETLSLAVSELVQPVVTGVVKENTLEREVPQPPLLGDDAKDGKSVVQEGDIQHDSSSYIRNSIATPAEQMGEQLPNEALAVEGQIKQENVAPTKIRPAAKEFHISQPQEQQPHAKVTEDLANALSQDQRLRPDAPNTVNIAVPTQSFIVPLAVREFDLSAQVVRTVSAGLSAANGSSTDAGNVRAQLSNGGRAELQRGRAKELTEPQVARTLEKVQEVIKELARSRDGKSISVRLDPPNLGSVKADITLRDGMLHARLTADNPQIAVLLRERAHELQYILRRSGLEVDQISVSIGGESNTSFNDRYEGGQTRRGGHRPNGPMVSAEAKQNIVDRAILERADHWVA